jgi:pyrroloquinoline quinone biosynthesis protein B
MDEVPDFALSFRGMRVVLSLVVSVYALGSFPRSAAQVVTASDWKLIVLGVAQDGGIPHLQCTRDVCAQVRAGKRHPEKVASIGVVNSRTGQTVLFEATPDLPAQVHALTGGRPPDRIFLTHAHIGHYTGLMYLGREAIGAKEVPVFATERMVSFLRANGPWSLLVSNRNIALQSIELNRAVDVGPGLRVTAFPVPHRDEFTDTVGYRIEGPRATAVYVPDTDRWETWKTGIRDLAETADLAFLDGTFASPSEVQGRDISEIPHPMMSVTRKLLAGVRARVWFIHINHTNAELDARDVVREGMSFEL